MLLGGVLVLKEAMRTRGNICSMKGYRPPRENMDSKLSIAIYLILLKMKGAL